MVEKYDRSFYCQGMDSKDFSASEKPPRQSKGAQSRAAILVAAAKLATPRGLEGLSIGDLASDRGMSKSCLYAHFRSKEELDLATIETAAQIFDRDVVASARDAPRGLR